MKLDECLTPESDKEKTTKYLDKTYRNIKKFCEIGASFGAARPAF